MKIKIQASSAERGMSKYIFHFPSQFPLSVPTVERTYPTTENCHDGRNRSTTQGPAMPGMFPLGVGGGICPGSVHGNGDVGLKHIGRTSATST